MSFMQNRFFFGLGLVVVFGKGFLRLQILIVFVSFTNEAHLVQGLLLNIFILLRKKIYAESIHVSFE